MNIYRCKTGKEARETIMASPGARVKILSGEGEVGRIRDYTGALSAWAINKKLRDERCGGDRWAVVLVEC